MSLIALLLHKFDKIMREVIKDEEEEEEDEEGSDRSASTLSPSEGLGSDPVDPVAELSKHKIKWEWPTSLSFASTSACMDIVIENVA